MSANSLGARLLDGIERTGNRLPDPVTIFVILSAVVILISIVAATTGLSVVHPVTQETVVAANLLSTENLRRLMVEMPDTFADFPPLGLVLVVMIGAGLAEKAGLFGTALRAAMKAVPGQLLTPSVVFLGLMSNLAVDAGYVVLIPLGAIVFAAAGRHPVAGLCAAFFGVSAGFSANIIPAALDAVLYGITESSAQIIDPTWSSNIAFNWWFIVALTPLTMIIGTVITERVVIPRLGQWTPTADYVSESDEGFTDSEKKGLNYAGLALIGFLVLVVMLTALPGAPLRLSLEELAAAEALSVEAYRASASGVEIGVSQLAPFFESLVALSLLLFLATGLAYGIGAGKIRNDRDAVALSGDAMNTMGTYILLAFTAAHFIALFNWSNLGLIMAINGADLLRSIDLPGPILIAFLVIFAASLNLFVGSASGKWAFLGPVVVPLLMQVGYSPELTTAAYRIGDGATNIITPLLPYFPLILVFARKYDGKIGLGSLVALMLPYSLAFMAAGIFMLGLWFATGLPLGPDAGVTYSLPSGS